jgi:hypothetical protein
MKVHTVEMWMYCGQATYDDVKSLRPIQFLRADLVMRIQCSVEV